MLVEPSPLQPLHFLLNIPEHARRPVDYAVEVCLQLIDVAFSAMAAHVAADIALANPLQRPLQEVLSVSRPNMNEQISRQQVRTQTGYSSSR